MSKNSQKLHYIKDLLFNSQNVVSNIEFGGEIHKYVKANWYPKDMKLQNTLTRGLNEENSQKTLQEQSKTQSQTLKAKPKIASKALSNANQKQAYYGR